MTFRRQCSHQCSQSENKAAERWGVRKRLLIFKRRAEPRSTLHFFIPAQFAVQKIGNVAIESLCENFTKSMLCHGTPQCCLCLSCVYCVWGSQEKRQQLFFAVILRILWTLLLLVIINLLFQQIEKSSAFFLLVSSFYFFFFSLLICNTQWCITVFTGPLCVHYFFSATRGRSATTSIMLISLYKFPHGVQVLYHYNHVWHWYSYFFNFNFHSSFYVFCRFHTLQGATREVRGPALDHVPLNGHFHLLHMIIRLKIELVS